MRKFYPLPFGHAEVRIDERPAGQRPLRGSGPVEGVWGSWEFLSVDERDLWRKR